MATKKAASTKKATVKKPAQAAKTKTTVRTLRADDKVKAPKSDTTDTDTSETVAASRPVLTKKRSSSLPSNIVNIVFVELLGTFILTLVALFVAKETGALLVGLTLALLVFAAGAISGAHVNPAVTFGLWTMRRLKSILLPFYWGAQLLGAMLAVIVINLLTNNGPKLDFGHFASFNWSLFGVELIGTLIFLFGLAAVLAKRELSLPGRAFGIGLSLTVGLVVATTLYTKVYETEVKKYQASASSASGEAASASRPEIPHAIFANGATLNPAVALATVEKTQSELTSGQATADEKQYTRFSLEVILGTLIGAALGGNLYLLVAGRRRAND